MDEVENKPSNVETKMWPEVGDSAHLDILGVDYAEDNFARLFGSVEKVNTSVTSARTKALKEAIVAAIDRTISAWTANTFTVQFFDCDFLGGGNFSNAGDAATLARYNGREVEFTAGNIYDFNKAYSDWGLNP
jgi:hypothetical protein